MLHALRLTQALLCCQMPYLIPSSLNPGRILSAVQRDEDYPAPSNNLISMNM